MIALAILCGVLALGMAGMALRISGLRGDVEKSRAQAREADRARIEAERTLVSSAHEFKSQAQTWSALRLSLKADIEALERDLQSCTTPEARRSRIERLFGKVTTT